MSKGTKTPSHLATRGKAFWDLVNAEFDIEPHDSALLVAACEMLDRAEAARQQVASDGVTITDRFSQQKPHPAIDIERQSLLAFIRIRREIGIDVPPPDSRPPLAKGYR